MLHNKKTTIFIFPSLVILLSFMLTSIFTNPFLAAENKSHMKKTFEAFGYIALIAFVGAAILYPIIVFLEDNNLFKICFVVALILGCISCLISMIVYHQHSDHVIPIQPSVWLLAVATCSFQLTLFVFINIWKEGSEFYM
uniref:SJCHGC06598 protein n=1 Tax=Schistosoma japonicum TaxID=6182 RepID=Q86F87_SCHJA|nr:SJCHGC06598 protein [Schistosoma japonicum]CAX76836.1 hypothetical protein [Schistosoma japonicum]CAX76837.1 hypothetical protein [Schistosoma japonicum]